MRTPGRVLIVILILAGACASHLPAQVKRPAPPKAQKAPPPPQRHGMLMVTFGAIMPQSKAGLTQFWKMGPSGSIRLLTPVSRTFALGMGFDASLLYFKRGAFSAAYPDVPRQRRNLAYLNLSLVCMYTLAPGRRTSAFIDGEIGASRFTGATYKVIINDVRTVYYDIPGRMRLTIGLGTGVDIGLQRWIAVRVEGRALYMHDDPNAGVTLALRAGLKFLL